MNVVKLVQEKHQTDRYDIDRLFEQNADQPGTSQDANISEITDPDFEPMRAPNGPGIQGAEAARDYPTMQRAMQQGCTTECTYERVYEHVIPSTPPSRKKFTAEIKHDFITPVPAGAAGNALNQHEFATRMTPQYTCWVSSDGWFVLRQLCPAMCQTDHYIHMLGACSRSRILVAKDTIILKELITYHTINHATDKQQVLSTKQPSLILVQSDGNRLPTMPQ